MWAPATLQPQLQPTDAIAEGVLKTEASQERNIFFIKEHPVTNKRRVIFKVA